jgi:hypothetical protein
MRRPPILLLALSCGLAWMPAAARDTPAGERPEATLVQLPGRVFYTSDLPARTVEASGRSPLQAAAGPGFHILQLAGPLKKAWMPRILGRDLELIAPLAPYNLIVWGTEAAVRRAAALPFVRWSGPLEPSDRVPAQLARSTADAGRLSVLLYHGEGQARALAALEALTGGPLRRLGSQGPLLRVLTPQQRRPLGQALLQIASIPQVLAVGTVADRGSIRDEMSDQITADNAPGGLPEPGFQAFLAAKGVDGSGVTVGVVDEGTEIEHPELSHDSPLCLDYTGSIPAVECGSPAPLCTSHGTNTAGIVLADGSSGVSFSSGGMSFLKGQGVAPGARLLAQNFLCTPDQGAVPPAGPLGWLHLSQDQVRSGAYVSANSWGPQTEPQGYDADTRDFDRMPRDADPETTYAAEPVVFVLSIMNGNGETSTQGTPDEGKNLIRVGATKNRLAGSIDDLCSCTAHGPALDGRMLPDLVAPGELIHSTNPGGHTGGNGRTGTSFASPHVSGAVALLTSWFQDDPELGYRPSPALLKAILVNSADDLFGGKDANGMSLGHRPDSKQGWGRLNLDRAVRPELSTLYFDQALGCTFTESGQSFTLSVSAQDANQPMRVSLVWTDAPGAGLGGTSAAWVNDLDLVVSDASTTYLGNVFGGGWSVPDGAADFKNNVENVFVQSPGPDPWQIRVEAANILGDGVYAGEPSLDVQDFDQDFALVCHNCVLAVAPDCTAPAVSGLSPGGVAAAVGLLFGLGALGIGRRGRKEGPR